MADLRVRTGDGSYASPSAVRVLVDGEWRDASTVKTLDRGQWVDVYPESDATSSASFVFVTESQLRTQKRRVEEGIEPFATAYDDLLASADGALGRSLQSVTDDNGDHTFLIDINGRYDYGAAIGMSETARDCGLAYWFTGEDRYAEKVIDVLHHWCLGEWTYMEPNSLIPNSATPIEQWITIPAFLYGASFVRDHPHWDTYDGSRPWDGGESSDAEAAFRRWVRDWHDTFPESIAGYCVINNMWPWRISNKAAAASYLGDDAVIDLAKRMYRAEAKTTCPDGSTRPRPWSEYRDTGSNEGYFKHELSRNNAFVYTAYNLLAHSTACAAFEAYDGTDLWSFNAPTDPYSGASLRKAFNWFREYPRDVSRWPYNEGGVSNGDVGEACVAYELAHARWDDYDDVIDDPDRIGGRPHWDRRVLGPVTLTHGRR
jgi:hypothetical protein